MSINWHFINFYSLFVIYLVVSLFQRTCAYREKSICDEKTFADTVTYFYISSIHISIAFLARSHPCFSNSTSSILSSSLLSIVKAMCNRPRTTVVGDKAMGKLRCEKFQYFSIFFPRIMCECVANANTHHKEHPFFHFQLSISSLCVQKVKHGKSDWFLCDFFLLMLV
jgi:hypothetical protein